jgi:hypothetical protein
MNKLFFLLLCFCAACSPGSQLNNISISITNNKQSLQFKGLDQDIIRRSKPRYRWQRLAGTGTCLPDAC